MSGDIRGDAAPQPGDWATLVLAVHNLMRADSFRELCDARDDLAGIIGAPPAPDRPRGCSWCGSRIPKRAAQTGRPAEYCGERCQMDSKARRVARRRSESLGWAVHHGQEWTGPELEVIARGDLSIEETGRLLGRTINAVTHARTRLKYDPKVIALAGIPNRE